MRPTDQLAFVLHARDYRETSQLVDFFTAEHGRIAAVAKGGRRQRHGVTNRLQPFVRYRIGWLGRSELKTLTGSEMEAVYALRGDAMAAGFYLNELLWYLLPQEEANEALFAAYLRALEGLSGSGQKMEPVLRAFERKLLEELGYGLYCDHEAASGDAIEPEQYYVYRVGEGLFYAAPDAEEAFSGACLMALERDDYSDATTLRAGKRIFRRILHDLLGGRELKSRALLAGGGSGS